jgi:crossover junction endodeoxyribonuclease RuvC
MGEGEMIIGIDPGISGGLAAILDKKALIQPVKKLTPRDIMEWLRMVPREKSICYLERVHSMPKQGVRSTFTFGQNFGTYIGILTALKIPFTYVSPGTWQRVMGCLSKGDKNVTKRKAQELFPDLKITHATADALLIAQYGRRMEAKHSPANTTRIFTQAFPDRVDDL